MNKTPLIETRDLKKYFNVAGGLLHAVDGINLKVNKGETLGVVGESGCGKTTLGRAILKLTSLTGGEIFYDGQDITHLSSKEMRKYRKKMQIIFQDPYSSIDPRMTVSESIAEYLKINKVCKSTSDLNQKIIELMELVGLAKRFASSYPHELDGGRRQRIGVARAISISPDFIVCDEPVSALDVSIQAQILNLLMDLQDNLDLTYLFITHDLSVVKHISDSILVMYLGHCVEMAKTNDLFNNPQHPYTKALLSAIPIPSIEAKNKKIEIIRGELSSPISPKPGCRFYPRCNFANEYCIGENIMLKDIGGEHYVACTLIN